MPIIKSINLRGTWVLDTINDECPICRNNVLDTCVECDANARQCPSIMGECNHVYHLHCIEQWIKTKNVCPLDNKKWGFKKPLCFDCNTSIQSNNHDISYNPNPNPNNIFNYYNHSSNHDISYNANPNNSFNYNDISHNIININNVYN